MAPSAPSAQTKVDDLVLENLLQLQIGEVGEQTQKDRRRVGRFARFAHLHPTAISQKVEVIVEHFRRHVMGMMKGQAKAMVVTAISRDISVGYRQPDFRRLQKTAGSIKP